LAGHIDTRGDGVPVIVFNPLGWPRTDVAEVDFGFGDPGVQDVALRDAAGNATPVQFTEADRYSDGSLKRAKLVFIAREVPALGYATYRVLPLRSPGRASNDTTEAPGQSVIENEQLRAALDVSTGALTSLFDKTQQWEVLSAPGNAISREQDQGDLWELYRGLDGGSYIAMTNQQAVPKPGAALFSTDAKGTNGLVRRGPVFSEFSVAHPFANGSFATRVRLYAGLRRLDVWTELVNNEKYVRYQALFPTSIRAGRNVQEIPFGAIERPTGIEFPAQHWVDWSDGRRGVALLNFGLPGNVVTDGTLMLSLLRAHNLGAYGFGGGYEPGMSSETGFELGQRRRFHYALVPHVGDWREAAVYRAGWEFNHPLLVHKTTAHAGSLPNRWGLLEISPANVVLTALKPAADGGTVLRVYEAAGQPTHAARIRLHTKIAAAHEANLLEDAGSKLNVRADTVQLDLRSFEIKTLKLRLGTAKSGG
jgi:alpha-mannosidase